jgi:WXG100 family type VII secretion target
MSDKIRVNYPALEDMAKHMQMSADRLTQSVGLANKISGQLQNGAMVGDAGQIVCEAFGIFAQRVTKLSEKYMEMANDIRQAMSDMRSADNDAGSKF